MEQQQKEIQPVERLRLQVQMLLKSISTQEPEETPVELED